MCKSLHGIKAHLADKTFSWKTSWDSCIFHDSQKNAQQYLATNFAFLQLSNLFLRVHGKNVQVEFSDPVILLVI